mmetsp:Transcript_58542/g.181315  ORF Transcript_58542/g.181315 Transcript_58542/m.181315 type:complete len:637 (+) Transcript_58542:164-2074(+)
MPEEVDENTPFAPSSSSHEHVAELVHEENIYTFMILYPEMVRCKEGHYWHSKVWQAMGLILLNFLLQASLTKIAGEQILTQNLAFRSTLVESTAPYAELGTVDRAVQAVADAVGRASSGWLRGGESKGCCDGAECAHTGMRCCVRNGTAKAGVNLLSRQNVRGQRPQKRGEKKSPKSNVLCDLDHGTMNCAPPTMHFLERWAELDTNGDGTWTYAEARADANNLGCRVGLYVGEVFHSVARSAEWAGGRMSNVVPEHQDPEPREHRQSISKQEFEYWRSVVALCSAADEARCGQLIEEGIFNKALISHDVGLHLDDLDDALNYCQRMLITGGHCERILPVSYLMFRRRVEEKCGATIITSGPVFTNPGQPTDSMTTVSVDYQNVKQYTTAIGSEFSFFICLILIVWYVTLVGELISVISFADFSVNFPGTDDSGLQLGPISENMRDMRLVSFVRNVGTPRPLKRDDSLEEVKEIPSISWPHRVNCFILVVLRVWMLVYMAVVGTVFVLATYSYADLLMNAVALAFVFELPEFFYTILVPPDIKEQLSHVEPLRYTSSLPGNPCCRLLLSRYLWGLLIIPCICVAIVHWNYNCNTVPVYEALRCACLQEGRQCVAREYLSHAWWDSFWQSQQGLQDG